MPYLSFTGKVTRLYVNTAGTNVYLDSYNNSYLNLPLAHANYDAIYSMLLTAHVERLEIRLRMNDYDVNDPPSHQISYIVMDQ